MGGRVSLAVACRTARSQCVGTPRSSFAVFLFFPPSPATPLPLCIPHTQRYWITPTEPWMTRHFYENINVYIYVYLYICACVCVCVCMCVCIYAWSGVYVVRNTDRYEIERVWSRGEKAWMSQTGMESCLRYLFFENISSSYIYIYIYNKMDITRITLNKEVRRAHMSRSNQSSTLWSGTVPRTKIFVLAALSAWLCWHVYTHSLSPPPSLSLSLCCSLSHMESSARSFCVVRHTCPAHVMYMYISIYLNIYIHVYKYIYIWGLSVLPDIHVSLMWCKRCGSLVRTYWSV